MLHSVHRLCRGFVHASDGIAGHADQLVFDNISWKIRYLVVRVGTWLEPQYVLIQPALICCDSPQRLSVAATCREVATSPDISSDPYVAHQHLLRALSSSPAPLYCCEPGLASMAYRSVGSEQIAEEAPPHWNPDLQGTAGVSGYAVAARDATFGRVDDFLVDDTTWSIRAVVIQTGFWKWSKRVVIEPHRIRAWSWTDGIAVVDMWREDIEQNPEATQFVPHEQPPVRGAAPQSPLS